MRAIVHIDVTLEGLREEEGMVLFVLRVDDLRLHLHNFDLIGVPLVLLRIDVKKVLQLLVLPLDTFPKHHIDILCFLTGMRPWLMITVL